MKTEVIASYENLLSQFSDTLKETSVDKHKIDDARYMTLNEKLVVNLDRFKDAFVGGMALTAVPKSCDALLLTNQGVLFMIEFKNGKIEAKKNYEIKVKVFESLLMLSEKFSQTIEFMRDNAVFILVYNESVDHGSEQFGDTGDSKDSGIRTIEDSLFKLAKTHQIRFGLHRFKKLYFKEVYTYSKAEFETEFVEKWCVGKE
jgi:hypothetical protein